MTNKSEQAFTLVELLVSVAIVGILAAMSVAIFREYKEKALLANIKIIAIDTLNAAEAWVSTDWDQTTLQVNSWLHYANNTNGYGGSGAEFRDFYDVNTHNQDFMWYPRLDTRCYVDGLPCSSNITLYSCAGHCEVVDGSDMERFCIWNYKNGLSVKEMSNYSAAFYGC